MYRIYWRGEISCAHKLNLPYESKCKNLHGHNYIIEVWVEGKKLNKEGMLVDFSKIKKVVMQYDHTYLNKYIENPTAEKIAKQLTISILEVIGAKEIINRKITAKVRVWEDKDSWAEYEIIKI